MRRLIAMPTVLLALAAAGCSGGPAGADLTTAASSPGGAPDPPGGSSSPGSSPGVPGQPVACGEIPDALGDSRSVALFADPGSGGTVGCEEAHDVMSEFFLRAPQQSGETEGTLAVRGWFCQYESGPTGTWITTCRKDTLEMHTEEPPGSEPPSEEPGAPDESELPSIPDEPTDPLEEPSTEEL
ncbi:MULTISPECIES: hypothetical protein [unclassified Streptomyces]|uniref:hypothetical protein n=1 Tax=unclassified Streptomyces TaxID=2593676 RepID=UPI003825B69F